MPALPRISDGDNPIAIVGAINSDYTIYVDELPATGATVLGHGSHNKGGGKGANAAVAAAWAGGQAYLIGCLGPDSAQLHKELEQHQVRRDYIATSRLGTPSGMAFITVDKNANNTIAVSVGANAELTAEHIIASLSAISPRCILISAEIPPDCILKTLQYAKEQQIPTVFNPAPIPASLIPHLKDLAWDGLILTPNEGEAQELSQKLVDHIISELEPEYAHLPISFKYGMLAGHTGHLVGSKQGRGIAEHLQCTVITTLGGDGVLLTHVLKSQLLPARKVDAIDTVGAGDTFNGYLAVAIGAGMELTKAAKLAVEAATISTTYLGARPPLGED